MVGAVVLRLVVGVLVVGATVVGIAGLVSGAFVFSSESGLLFPSSDSAALSVSLTASSVSESDTGKHRKHSRSSRAGRTS